MRLQFRHWLAGRVMTGRCRARPTRQVGLGRRRPPTPLRRHERDRSLRGWPPHGASGRQQRQDRARSPRPTCRTPRPGARTARSMRRRRSATRRVGPNGTAPPPSPARTRRRRAPTRSRRSVPRRCRGPAAATSRPRRPATRREDRCEDRCADRNEDAGAPHWDGTRRVPPPERAPAMCPGCADGVRRRGDGVAMAWQWRGNVIELQVRR